MQRRLLQLGDASVELITDEENFVGIATVRIGEKQVRSGRLPLSPYFQTFQGHELSGLKLVAVDESTDEVRIKLTVSLARMPVQMMRDHSFDVIHDTNDWDTKQAAETAQIDLVIRPASDQFGGLVFDGFSYHYEYQSDDVPIFYLLDRASWELGGDIAGATCYSQSSCSDPAVTFEPNTAWTTEGILFFLAGQNNQNPIMTHNLPRWASHGSFDFQFKGDDTLIGVFDHVSLIRSLLKREPRHAELKCFDKHIFDESLVVSTTPKKILLNSQSKSQTDQKNLWTWIHCEVEERARAEFGLVEEPMIPTMSQNFWCDFTVEDYYTDLVPAAAAIGCKRIFVDNLKKSAMTEKLSTGNMCCAHEYEIAPELGGEAGVRQLVDDCREQGIEVFSWTNNTQSLSSPLHLSERDDQGWYVHMEDTRQKYGGSYICALTAMDLNVAEAFKYFVDSHIDIRQKTGLSGYLYDSFYNLAFMPVNFSNCRPTTMWRALLDSFKQLQDAGIHFHVESFGPFGAPQHGHPSSYNLDTVFICYKVGLGNDYTTIPTQHALKDMTPTGADGVYYALAHMAYRTIPLFENKVRIDKVWINAHKRALADYHVALPFMHRRFLQEDGCAVVWHDRESKHAVVWNFVDRTVELPGQVVDMSYDNKLQTADAYALQAGHTYMISGCELPTKIHLADTQRAVTS